MNTDWPVVKIGEVCEIVSGGTPKSGIEEYWGGPIGWVTPKDLSALQGAYIDSTPRTLTESGLKNCSAKILPPNSVLFSSRAPIGHVAINTTPMATNQGFKSFLPDSAKVDYKFLYWWLLFRKPQIQRMGTGATFKEISKRVTERIDLVLPPIDEQRRIASILDSADDLRTKRRQALAKLDTLTQAIFIDMFGDYESWPNRWPIRSIGEIVESATYGTSKKAGSTGKYPILRMGNISYAGEISMNDLKFIDIEEKDQPKHLVHSGDILFNRTNSAELVGKTGVYRGAEPVAYAGYLVRLRVNDLANSEYIGAFMNLPSTKQLLRSKCKSIVGMANINAKEVQKIKLPVAPKADQDKFADRVSLITSKNGEMRRLLDTSGELFGSLQQKAFRGEL